MWPIIWMLLILLIDKREPYAVLICIINFCTDLFIEKRPFDNL